MATNHQNVRNILNWYDDSYNKAPINVFVFVQINQWRTDNTSGPKNKSPLLDSFLIAYIYICIYIRLDRVTYKNVRAWVAQWVR
jgi:hypothetical protein